MAVRHLKRYASWVQTVRADDSPDSSLAPSESLREESYVIPKEVFSSIEKE